MVKWLPSLFFLLFFFNSVVSFDRFVTSYYPLLTETIVLLFLKHLWVTEIFLFFVFFFSKAFDTSNWRIANLISLINWISVIFFLNFFSVSFVVFSPVCWYKIEHKHSKSSANDNDDGNTTAMTTLQNNKKKRHQFKRTLNACNWMNKNSKLTLFKALFGEIYLI